MYGAGRRAPGARNEKVKDHPTRLNCQQSVRFAPQNHRHCLPSNFISRITVRCPGVALIGAYTFGYTVHGQRGEWKVSITSPGNITKSDETTERTWYPLFTEMLSEAYHAAQKKRFQSAALRQRRHER